ncbi:MAG: hypothetical protein WC840_03775 [Candidatus Peribacteraceae bacterium]
MIDPVVAFVMELLYGFLQFFLAHLECSQLCFHSIEHAMSLGRSEL